MTPPPCTSMTSLTETPRCFSEMSTRRWRSGGAAVLLAVVALASLPEMVRAFSKGAPETSCASMLPGHGVPPQQTPSPFAVTMVPWEDLVKGRRFVNVTLTSDKDIEFAGFLLQARPESGGNALGSFVVDTAVSKTHTCGSGIRVRYNLRACVI